MARDPQQTMRSLRPGAARNFAALTSALMLSACAQTADLMPKSNTLVADAAEPAATGQSELQRATIYWGQEYAKKPSELEPALNYARNLKALGQKRQALAVLQRASAIHSSDPDLAGEYGRLALDLDQLSVAGKLLEVADNATKPDWRVISARGTVLAKQGQYKQAIPYYERALALQQNQASVLNNLAMAYAMSGEPKKAEELLRQASATPESSPKIRQNLALVLGLQGRYDESKTYAVTDLAADAAASNTDYIRRMVKLEPKAAPVAATPTAAFTTDVARAPTPQATQAATLAATPASFATEVKRAVAQPMAPAAQAQPLFKPAALDVVPVAANAPAWQTNVAASASPPNRPAASPTASTLKGSSQ